MNTAQPDPDGTPERITLRVGGAKMTIESGRAYTIGSDSGNDLRLAHSSIAPRHAKLILSNGQVALEDLGSATGIWLGKHRLEAEQVLLPGMQVRLGEITLELEDSAAQDTIAASIAAVPKVRQLPVAHLKPHLHDESFAEIMAEQLRHAPWFALSIALHAILLFLLWMFLPPPKQGSALEFRLNLASESTFEDGIDGDDVPVEEIEVEKTVDNDLQELAQVDDMPEPNQDLSEDWGDEATIFGHEAGLFEQLGGLRGDDILNGGGSGTGKTITRKFKSDSRKLRISGLDICFVFDSTGSMGPVLKNTKESITQMVEVLHALVPKSRIGIVTFRDKDDEYLTRSVPVSTDYYRAINFVQTIEADGGDDRPEAIYEALKAGIRQPWGKRSKRIVVLIGDAPPHKKTNRKIQSLVKNFARQRNASIHTITTSPDIFGEIDKDTASDFAKIAKYGKGHALTFDKQGELLKQVLSIAFGKEHRDSLDEIYRRVESRKKRVSPRIRDIVRRADTQAITAELRKQRIDDDLVRLLAKSTDPKIAKALIQTLSRKSSSSAGRNAAAFALQQILSLSEPYYDAESGRPIGRADREWLNNRVAKRLGIPPR